MQLVKFCRSVFLCAGLCTLAGNVSASSFSFTGDFATDDQQEIFSFVAGPGSAILRTWGYAGGVNANGNMIAAGGFDPILSLFGPGATLLGSTPLLTLSLDGGALVPVDVGEHFDSYIDTSSPPTLVALTPGLTYFLVLTENDNSPLGNTFGAGFSATGSGNFTGIFGCGSDSFCDIDTNQRNGHWAVDILGVNSAVDLSNPTTPPSVPEPASIGLLVSGAVLCFSLRKKLSVG